MTTPNTAAPTLAREIRFRDGLSLVVGGIIGSGIFFVPAAVSAQLGSLSAVLLVWIVGGLLSLAGALSVAELAAALPRTGGLTVYLEEAYGPWAGFLYGWGQFIMINSGTVATLGVAFAGGVAELWPLPWWAHKSIAIASILSLTWFNYRGLRMGTFVMNLFTVAKVAGIGFVVVLLFSRGRALEMWSADFWPAEGLHFAWGPFGLALVAVLWAYEGWHIVSFTAGEFTHPARDLHRSFAWGTLIIITIYLVTNLAYYAVLSGPEVAALAGETATPVAGPALVRAAGPWAGLFVTLLILTSVYGSNNGQVLAGPRVFYAMAEEGLFFRAFARVHPRYRTPSFSIVMQGVIASSLTLIGTFEELFTYVIFTHWIFYAATVAAVLVLRRTRPALDRPFRVPLYPWLPLAFVLAATGIILNTVVADWVHSLVGIAFILTGVPAYLVFRRGSVAAAPPARPAD